MPSTDLNATLLATTMVRLLGRTLGGFVPAGGKALKIPKEYLGDSQLVDTLKSEDLRIAHIFGFTFAGRYIPLHVPALFIVQGGGETVTTPVDPQQLGLAHVDGTVKFPADFQFWAYDSGNETIRLDFTLGTLQKLVIDAETGHGGGQARVDFVGAEGQFAARLGRGSY